MQKMLEALKHAEERLNQLPHNYEDTNFKLIREGIEEGIKEGIKEGKETQQNPSMKELLWIRNALRTMRDLYIEKRTDVENMCQAILDGKEPEKEDTEHRYVCWKFNGKEFIYDTLTTLVEVDMEEDIGWVQVDGIEYKDDE